MDNPLSHSSGASRAIQNLFQSLIFKVQKYEKLTKGKISNLRSLLNRKT